MYGCYSYHPNLLTPLLEKIISLDQRINSLILTNLMKSISELRIDMPALYDRIVELVKKNYSSLDNIALMYCFTRFVKLAQFEHAIELFHFYNEIKLFESLRNPHNTAQVLNCLATLGIYDEYYWNILIENTDKGSISRASPGMREKFIHTTELTFKLCELECPELYEKLKNSFLYKKSKEMKTQDNQINTTVTQKTIAEG